MKLRHNLVIGLFFVIAVLPVCAGLIYELLYSLGLAGILAKGLTFDHWIVTLTQSGVGSSLVFSLWVATISMVLIISISLWFVGRFRMELRKGWRNTLIYLPLTLPPIVMAFVVFLFFGDSGFLARVGFNMGLIENANAFPDLVNDSYGIGIILTHVFIACPFFVLIFLGHYQDSGVVQLAQVARTLGATENQVKLRVVYPVILKRSFSLIILYFIFMFGAYEVPLLLGSQDPRMISILAIEKMQRFDLNDKPVAYSISLLYSLIVLLATSLLFSGRRRFAK